MRDKAEILNDALVATEKPITDVRSHVKLTILTLEALIDLRDQLSAVTTILGSVEKIAYKTY